MAGRFVVFEALSGLRQTDNQAGEGCAPRAEVAARPRLAPRAAPVRARPGRCAGLVRNCEAFPNRVPFCAYHLRQSLNCQHPQAGDFGFAVPPLGPIQSILAHCNGRRNQRAGPVGPNGQCLSGPGAGRQDVGRCCPSRRRTLRGGRQPVRRKADWSTGTWKRDPNLSTKIFRNYANRQWFLALIFVR